MWKVAFKVLFLCIVELKILSFLNLCVFCLYPFFAHFSIRMLSVLSLECLVFTIQKYFKQTNKQLVASPWLLNTGRGHKGALGLPTHLQGEVCPYASRQKQASHKSPNYIFNWLLLTYIGNLPLFYVELESGYLTELSSLIICRPRVCKLQTLGQIWSAAYFVNKVLLEHSRNHLLPNCLWQVSW